MISDAVLVLRGIKRILPHVCKKSQVDPLKCGATLVTQLARPIEGFLNQPPPGGNSTAIYYDMKRHNQKGIYFQKSSMKLKGGLPPRRHFSASARLNFLSKDDLEKARLSKSARIEQSVQASKVKLQSKARARHVPATRVQRVVGFGTGVMGVGASMLKNRVTNAAPAEDPILREIGLRENDVEVLVQTLCKMRGAALKLGQFLSIQDENFISPQLAAILERVRQTADYMPQTQLTAQLEQNLGSDWESKFDYFDLEPFAAASIGQVHRAKLNGRDLAVKVQYPGVAESFFSDIDNLVLVLDKGPIKLPDTLFLPKIVDFARRELTRECDYKREMDANIRMKTLLAGEEGYFVPAVYPELCTEKVLTTDFVEGVPIDQLDVEALDQDERNFIGQSLLKLCIREVFEFRFMQTDPNYSNFLYQPGSFELSLIDMGACIEYPERFTTPYMELVAGAVMGDREIVYQKSVELGFLTGAESQKMKDAHVSSVMIVGQPYQPEPYDFFNHQMTAQIAEHMPTMFRERLTPPPEETYTLHRKLSGAFLMCAKVKAQISCRTDFIQTLRTAGFGDLADLLE